MRAGLWPQKMRNYNQENPIILALSHFSELTHDYYMRKMEKNTPQV